MRGFLTTLLLCLGAGLLFANLPSSSLLSDGPVISPVTMAVDTASSTSWRKFPAACSGPMTGSFTRDTLPFSNMSHLTETRLRRANRGERGRADAAEMQPLGPGEKGMPLNAAAGGRAEADGAECGRVSE